MDPVETRSRILGYIFLLERKLDAIGNRDFGEVGLTTKQWFVMITIAELGGTPSITDVAEKMSTSHQNIKQLALQLQRKGFLDIAQDESDKRRHNLVLTEHCRGVWSARSDRDSQTIVDLFDPLSDQEASELLGMLERLVQNIDKAQ